MATTMLQTPDVLPGMIPVQDDPYRLQSLDRALSILKLLGESEVPLSLSEICRRSSLHKSTVHRALMVLERGMLLERTPKNSFRLGLELFDLGNRAVQQMGLRGRLLPHLRRLSTQLGETVHLGVMQKTSVVYLGKIGTKSRACTGSKMGSSNPAYCTALGKAVMAWMPPAVVDNLVEQMSFQPLTEKTICSREKLLDALERTRRRGYSLDDEEVEAGVRCIGAPIFDSAHMPIAAMSVSIPTLRIPPHRVPVLAERLVRCCAEASTSLRIQHRLGTHNMERTAAAGN